MTRRVEAGVAGWNACILCLRRLCHSWGAPGSTWEHLARAGAPLGSRIALLNVAWANLSSRNEGRARAGKRLSSAPGAAELLPGPPGPVTGRQRPPPVTVRPPRLPPRAPPASRRSPRKRGHKRLPKYPWTGGSRGNSRNSDAACTWTCRTFRNCCATAL
jgi:hypothetical protein